MEACGPEQTAKKRSLQVDAGEDHGQLRRVQLDAVAIAGVGHLETADLEPFVPDGQAVMIEIECLDAISAAVDEEEEMAVEEVLTEALLDEAREAVEALPHIDGSGAEEARTAEGSEMIERPPARVGIGQGGDEPSEPDRIGSGDAAEADEMG